VTPLPDPLGPARLVAWRLDQKQHAETWDSGEGAFRFGGRWNGKGVRAVYCSLDPATAILEVAVHKGFRTLDTVPHVLTAMEVLSADRVQVVHPENVPNQNWLVPGIPGRGQQDFGDRLLREHPIILIPSAVSRHSWNLVFLARAARRYYRTLLQEPFALDTRLHPPA
jgi:RES domain-containing protein